MSRPMASLLSGVRPLRQVRSSTSTSTTSRVTMLPNRLQPFRKYASSSSSPFEDASFKSQLRRPTTILLIFVPIVTFSLGVWQIQRLKWKVALIDEVERNMAREPLSLPNKINIDALPEFAFRRVFLKGTLLAPCILLGPRVEQGVPGWDLIQPFARSSPSPSISLFSSSSSSSETVQTPSIILLNRGFIANPQAVLIRDFIEPPPNLGEEIEVEGLLAKLNPQGWSPDNTPGKGEWYWKDVERMVEWVGGEARGVQAVLVDAIDRGDEPVSLMMQRGEPIGKPPVVELRNQHASYAATWFSLSAATSAMLVFLFRKGRGGVKPRGGFR